MRLLPHLALAAAAAAVAAEAFVLPGLSFAPSESLKGGVSPSTALFASPPSDQEGRPTNTRDGTSKSVGDVVQNLHGGKYLFSETQYLAGGSVVGQQFAESLCSGDGAESIVEDADEDGELPRWALKLQDWERQIFKPLVGTLMFDAHCREHAFSIQNVERSWEKYYAFVLPNEEEGGSFRVSPAACGAELPTPAMRRSRTRTPRPSPSSGWEETRAIGCWLWAPRQKAGGIT